MKKKKGKQPRKRPVVEVNVERLDQIVQKARSTSLNDEEANHLQTCIHVMAAHNKPPQRSTEKADSLLSDDEGSENGEPESSVTGDDREKPAKKKRKGHGRNGAAAYTGATQVKVPNKTLKPKDACPECHKGKLYDRDPKPLVRVTAMPPIQASVYNLQELRCNVCEKCFCADAPDGVGDEKYDESVPAMIGQLKYGLGMPFNRIEKLQKQMGIPLPAGTQWDLVNDAAARLWPIFDELIRQTAQSEQITYDDTFARILEKVERPEGQDPKRTGIKTTGIVAETAVGKIAVFLTGPQHAGENVGDVLKKRQKDLPPLKTMADALPCNKPKVPPGVEIFYANCLTHGRRKFVDVFDEFPRECRHVIEQLGLVYHYEQLSTDQGLSQEARLDFHQKNSGPVMEDLRKWMDAQISEKKTEPNSGLGNAIQYFTKRWDKLTLFLREPGASLDSNIVERALKKCILHRKNALFFKTQHGADVGDFFLSVIHTCELHQVNAFDYIRELLRHVGEVRANPGEWMPWNFRDQLLKPDTG